MTWRARATVLTGVALLSLAGCSAAASSPGASPEVPAGLDSLPATPLPADRNAIEAVDAADAPEAILAAVRRQTSATVTGELERRTTGEDGAVARSAVALAWTGTDRDYEASVSWDGATVTLSRAGDDLWVEADARYARQVGRPALVEGQCLGPGDALREQWEWLDGPDAILATLLGTAQVGGVEVEDEVATFLVAAGGPVVGTLAVSAVGDPVPLRLEVEDPSGSADLSFGGWSAGVPGARGCPADGSAS
ncbi:hypothetical protein [Demequina subtropica]|uniref:hypothetical protein n=1 Tax=Demequina subtropica TaxID=1638989 RepID=UPI000780F860|nr:hypothetical protein [Demequina subtropica]